MKKNDKVSINSGGGPVFLGKVNNRGTIKGRTDIHQKGMKAEEAARLFDNLYEIIERHSNLPVKDKADLKTEIGELRQELNKKERANESFLLQRFRNIRRMAPDILEVILAIIANPAAGFGIFAKKVAEKVKSTS